MQCKIWTTSNSPYISPLTLKTMLGILSDFLYAFSFINHPSPVWESYKHSLRNFFLVLCSFFPLSFQKFRVQLNRWIVFTFWEVGIPNQFTPLSLFRNFRGDWWGNSFVPLVHNFRLFLLLVVARFEIFRTVGQPKSPIKSNTEFQFIYFKFYLIHLEFRFVLCSCK